jgi:hypothetical protein
MLPPRVLAPSLAAGGSGGGGGNDEAGCGESPRGDAA